MNQVLRDEMLHHISGTLSYICSVFGLLEFCSKFGESQHVLLKLLRPEVLLLSVILHLLLGPSALGAHLHEETAGATGLCKHMK